MEPGRSRHPRVFVSYSWADKPLARRVARRLGHAGVEVVFDEVDLEAGQALTAALREKITGSTHLVVVWTVAAAASPWVRQELDFAATVSPDGPTIIPLLLAPPGNDPVVSDRIGITVQHPHRFEHAFERLLKAMFPNGWAEPTVAQLDADLKLTVSETPRIAGLLRNPVLERHERIVMSLQQDPEEPVSSAELRERALPALTEAFEAWKADRPSLVGLPTVGDHDYHALDFALWCSVRMALARRAEVAPLLPVELAKYPELIGMVLGATCAGYEALLLLLTEYPDLASRALVELIARERVAENAVPAVVELFETVFALCRASAAPDQFTPYGAMAGFLGRNRDRLSETQKERFFAMAEPGPYPGGPVDLLAALRTDPAWTTAVVARVRLWAENGLFDRFDAERGSDTPALFFVFVASMLREGLHEPAGQLLETARIRLRKLFRSDRPEGLVAALRWLADADRLPMAERGVVLRGYQEGVFSVEFESSEHSSALTRFAILLARSVTRDERTDPLLREQVREELAQAGLPDHFR